MNLPNKITLFRVFMIPVYVVLMILAKNNTMLYMVSGIVFGVASISDFIDGKIARKYDLVTSFGKFVDPLADKLLTMSAMLCLVEISFIPAWVVIVILAREFAITGLRTIAANEGIVMAADNIGKWKTATQMFALAFYHFVYVVPQVSYVADVLMVIAVALTLISGVNYMYKNRQLFNTMK